MILVSEMTHRKLVTTGAYNLRCKHIVHIDTVYYTNNDRLKTAYEDILEEAENLAVSSIALPAIGTGRTNAWNVCHEPDMFPPDTGVVHLYAALHLYLTV